MLHEKVGKHARGAEVVISWLKVDWTDFSFVSVSSLFEKEINAFDSFGIEWLVVTV